MIKVKVNSIWQGKVALREKYVQEAYEKRTGLEIHHNGSVMVIPYLNIQKRIVGRSDQPVHDKFGGGFHWLFYFDWKPNINQKKLL